MLNHIEECRFAKMRDLCRELKMPPPVEIFVGSKLIDKNGIVLFDDIQRGHSWTRNYWNMQMVLGLEASAFGDTTFGAGKISSKNYAGAIVGTTNTSCIRASSQNYAGAGVMDTSSASNFGILIGTGVTAWSIDDYALATKIVHGNASNQMSYTAMATAVPTYASKVWTNVLSRIFNNNSGGTIVVAETALVMQSYLFSATSQYLIDRSVLASSISTPNGAQLTVSYTLTMDFSAID